jgi:hypothetical protein
VVELMQYARVKRTTMTLTDDFAGALEREARRRRLSVMQITREALSAHLGIAADEPRRLPFAALGASGHPL